jgi:hypothetical protein
MRWAEWRTHDWRDQSRPTSRPARKANRLAGFESGDGLEGTITPDGLTHFLAQVLHESGDLTIEHENIENMKYKAPAAHANLRRQPAFGGDHTGRGGASPHVHGS